MEGCKGCLNCDDICICRFEMYDASLCPCQICLIKGICIEICEEYNKFRKKDDEQILKGR